ncbi:hypothetical protein O5542_30450, partial [Escherichia coli]|nr:hypothetical protein [Escherichia coli]
MGFTRRVCGVFCGVSIGLWSFFCVKVWVIVWAVCFEFWVIIWVIVWGVCTAFFFYHKKQPRKKAY